MKISSKFCLVLLFSLIFCVSALRAAGVRMLSDGVVQVEADFPPVQDRTVIIHPDGWDADGLKMNAITMEGIRSLGHPGEPVLPVYPVTVLIPQDRELVDVKFIPGAFETATGKYLVQSGQPEVPLCFSGPFRDVPPNREIYSQTTPYPRKCVEQVTAQFCRGYHLVTFNFRPVVYFPAQGTLHVYRHMAAQIITRKISGPIPGVVRCRDLPCDAAWVKRKVLNPELVETYRAEAPPDGTALSGQRDNYPYVIVTDTDFQPQFQLLINHKQSHGYPGTVVTMNWVQENYSGEDRAEQLRHFIFDAYNNWNTQFVLLGGDDDKSYNGGESGDYIVPRRDFYSSTDFGESDDEIPSDMYYACLDGTFNHDNDNLWAEPTDGINGGEVDWFGEVGIGRACVDSTSEAENFVNFLINYENADPNASFTKKAYMIGELLWEAPNLTYGADYKDEIKNGASTHGYTTVGFPEDWTVDTLYDKNIGTWTTTQLYSILNSNDLEVLNHLGHADVDYCMRMSNSDFESHVSNTMGFFGYTQGCYDGSFDNRDPYGDTLSSDCILEHFTCKDAGPFAFIGNSRYGWGEYQSTNGSSQYYDRQFFDAIFGEGILELGLANQDSKEDNIGYLAFAANRWCGYELNLFGDPQTPLGGGLSRTGMIFLDRTVYGNHVPVNITVKDLDLNINASAVDSANVTITTQTGDSETVTLTETGSTSAIFEGSIEVAEGAASPGNGIVETQNGFTLTAHYIDADDGQGGFNIERTADATADFLGPAISHIAVEQVTDTSAVITFLTSEPSSGVIIYGKTPPPEQISEGDSGNTTHRFVLQNLDQCSYYYFFIQATDPAGNTTTDDASGTYYTFPTLERVDFLSEDMSTDPGWTTELQWQYGHPTGGSGDHGAADPENGYSGTNVYGYNLNGGYPDNMADTAYLTTPPIDCSEGSGTKLTFMCWLGVERNIYDHASIRISTNGTDWETIWSNPETTLAGGTWEPWEFDISAQADGQSTVYIRWGMGPTDSGWTYCGWNIDDVTISFCRECTQPSPTPRPTRTPTQPPTATPNPPTATPGKASIDLTLNAHVFTAGDPFLLKAVYTNPGPQITLDEYIILDVFGTFFFWPGWSSIPEYRRIILEPEQTNSEDILEFTWPDGSFGHAEGLCFWAAFLVPGTTTVYGDIDNEVFGYR